MSKDKASKGSEEIVLNISSPTDYVMVETGGDSSGFWIDNEPGAKIHARLIGFVSAALQAKAMGVLVEAELLQPCYVTSQEGEGENAVRVRKIADKGSRVWVGVRNNISELSDYASEGINVKFYLEVTEKIKIDSGKKTLYKYVFQCDPESAQELKMRKRQRKAVHELDAATNPLS